MKLTLSGIDAKINGLTELRESLKGGDRKGALVAAWRNAAIAAARIFINVFKERGARYGEQWKQPSPLSKVLRAKGGRKYRFETMEDIEGYDVNPLRDTGKGFQSFQPGKTGNILEAGPMGSRIGSSVVYMEKHSDIFAANRKSKFIFGPQQQYRMKKNMVIEREYAGPRGGILNPVFGKLWGIAKNSHGKEFTLPRRQIVPDEGSSAGYKQEEIDRINKAFDAGFNKFIRSLGI